MYPTCGQLLKDCLCRGLVGGLVVCTLCQALKEPTDKHDHPKAPKAETTINEKYIMTATSSPMPIATMVSNQQIKAIVEKFMKDIKEL